MTPEPSTRTLAKQYGLFHGDITAFSLKHHCTRLEAADILSDQKRLLDHHLSGLRNYLAAVRQRATPTCLYVEADEVVW